MAARSKSRRWRWVVFPLLAAGALVWWLWPGGGAESARTAAQVVDPAEVLAKESPSRIIDPASWPASWFEAPRTASELGVRDFSESPMLGSRVEAGELEPLEERLPADPIVIEPLDEIGVHGGTARVVTRDRRLLDPPEPAFRMGPEARRVLPNLAKRAEFSEDGKTITIYLREGLRWSDGHPLTADDFVFWLEEIELHPEVTPAPAPEFRGASIRKIDELTFAYEYDRPMPLLLNYLAHGRGDGGHVAPKHFLKDFHADYADEDELAAKVRRYGIYDWIQLFHVARNPHSRMEIDPPVLGAYHRVNKSATVGYYERNPYYPKVDPAGNQLPYIDRMQVQEVDSPEIVASQAATGQLTFAGLELRSSDIPLFKRWEERNNYTAHIWQSIIGADVLIQPNMNHSDPRRRGIFQDRRFRQALSLAIDREEINQIVYFGQAVPRQNTVIPASRYYQEEFEQAYAAHDPDRARSLLDEMGMVDRSGDGRREHPDGDPVHITLEYHEIESPKRMVLELVISHWREVGIHVNLKPVESNLQWRRTSGNLMDMTVWHADRSTDILFPIEPYWYVPMRIGWELSLWNHWARWLLSDGERGERPPQEVRNLIAWWNEMRSEVDEDRRIELGRKILRSQAEHVWAIGTVGQAPRALVVDNRVGNVPSRGYWGWDTRWSMPYHPQTWYMRPE